MKTECDYLYGLIKDMVLYAKTSPKMANPRGLAGNAKEEKYCSPLLSSVSGCCAPVLSGERICTPVLSWVSGCCTYPVFDLKCCVSTKRECDNFYGWIKKMVTFTYTKISPKMVNPRDLAGNAEEEEEKYCTPLLSSVSGCCAPVLSGERILCTYSVG